MFLKPVVPVLEYVVFYDYIRNELCVNKDKPELECNGKCHLKKEMANAAASEKNDKNAKQFSVESTIVFFQNLPTSPHFATIFYTEKKSVSAYENTLYVHLMEFGIFRPPVV